MLYNYKKYDSNGWSGKSGLRSLCRSMGGAGGVGFARMAQVFGGLLPCDRYGYQNDGRNDRRNDRGGVDAACSSPPALGCAGRYRLRHRHAPHRRYLRRVVETVTTALVSCGGFPPHDTR